VRSNALDRAKTSLTEGRLIVTLVDGDTITANVRGSGEVHQCGHDPDRAGWWCSCEVRTDKCSHLHALRLVTCRRREP
jgi:hypothetical protein